MNEPIQLFSTTPGQCRKDRRYSSDRNGRYVFRCMETEGHPGPCRHRWQIHTGPTPDQAA